MRISPPTATIMSPINTYYDKYKRRTSDFIIYQDMINSQGENKSWQIVKEGMKIQWLVYLQLISRLKEVTHAYGSQIRV